MTGVEHAGCPEWRVPPERTTFTADDLHVMYEAGVRHGRVREQLDRARDQAKISRLRAYFPRR